MSHDDNDEPRVRLYNEGDLNQIKAVVRDLPSRREFLKMLGGAAVFAAASNVIGNSNEAAAAQYAAPPRPPPDMKRGLQAMFNNRMDEDTLYTLRQFGVDMLRIDAQGSYDPSSAPPASAAFAARMAQDAIDYQMIPYVIVRDGWQVAQLPPGSHVEVRNEPNIGGKDQQLEVKDYAVIMNRCIDAAHKREDELGSPIPVWVGVISNMGSDQLDYMKDLFSPSYRPAAGVGAAVHRYPNDTSTDVLESFLNPRKGFDSRDEEVQRLRNIIGADRKFGVSEVGYTTAERAVGDILGLHFGRSRWSDDEVLQLLRMEFNFWARKKADFAIVYQIADGTGDTGLDHFGIRRVDGTWKPAALAFK